MPPPAAEWAAWWHAHAWDRLLPAVQAHVRRSVPRTYLLSADELEDVESVVMVGCWKCRVVPTEPAAYVRTAARNAARTVFRRRRQNTAPLDPEDPRLVTQERTPLGVLIGAESRAEIRAALQRLPAHLRVPLERYELDGASCTVIALEEGVAVGALKMRLIRARRALQTIVRTARGEVVPPTRTRAQRRPDGSPFTRRPRTRRSA